MSLTDIIKTKYSRVVAVAAFALMAASNRVCAFSAYNDSSWVDSVLFYSRKYISWALALGIALGLSVLLYKAAIWALNKAIRFFNSRGSN